MTGIQVLLENIKVVALACTSTVLLLWAIWYFFRNLFGEAGRNPVKIAVSLVAIAGAGAGYALIPAVLSAGSDTGTQIGGGSSYSMPAPVKLPAHSDTVRIDLPVAA